MVDILEDKYVHGTEKHSIIAKAVWNLSITFSPPSLAMPERWLPSPLQDHDCPLASGEAQDRQKEDLEVHLAPVT